MLPTIEIEWNYFKSLDEIHMDDMRGFGMILLTLVKNDNVQIIAYEIKTQKWGLLRE